MSSIKTPNSASSFHAQRVSNSEIDRPSVGKSVTAGERSEQCLNPVQFSLAELFWVSVAVAVVLAIATPFLRKLPQSAFNTVISVVSVQTIAILAMTAFLSYRRKQMLERCGKRIALGSSSESPSVKWAVFFSFVSIFVTVVMQLFISVGLIWAISGKDGPGFFPTFAKIAIVLGQSISPSIFMTQSIRFLRWRIRSDAVEFFENGIATFDLLCPWGKVELRRSQFHQNRIMVYYHEYQSSVMVWLDNSEIDDLLLFAAGKCKDVIEHSAANAKP